jgi:ATP-dependent exoDNAse (exonuclease V) alpha subunit
MGHTENLKMKYYRVNNSFKVIHEHSEPLYKILFETIKDNCNKHSWNWGSKFYIEEMFAVTKYNHAITIHKSQGSTYKTSVINIGNILFNKNAEERQRMLYTAITRASDLVILNNVK